MAIGIAPIVLDGFYLVSVVLLLALGLAIIFGLAGVFNIAYGEFIVIGSYTVALMEPKIGFAGAVIMAPLITAFLGFILERGMIRHFYATPILGFIGTWGVSITLQQLLAIIFGNVYRYARNPLPFTVNLVGLNYSAYQLFIMAVSFSTLVVFGFVLLRTSFGVTLRAVIHDPVMSAALGVSIRNVHIFAFVFGSALAGLGGAIMAPLFPIFPYLGFYYVPQAFYTVMLGGLGQVLGVAVGALVVGQVSNVLTFLLSPGVAQLLLLVVIVVILRFRPKGLARRG